MENLKIDDILYYENNINKIIEDIKCNIKTTITNTPIEGVTPIKHSPSIFTVKLSTVHKNNSIISPEYYSADKQAEYVEHALKQCTTMSTFVKTMEKMIANKYIVINSNKYPLNPQTVGILEKWIQENLKTSK